MFTAPGNGGTENSVPISVDDLEGLADFAEERGCFTVVGPEAPLAMGIVDLFQRRGLEIFGPTKAAAQLESSKIWAKQFMRRSGIMTPEFEAFDDLKNALEYVDSVTYPVVVKADGLAAGKGVIVCSGTKDARGAVEAMLGKGELGGAGSRIVVEERVDGFEASYIALCDGSVAVPMASSRDYKRAYDRDLGPNTGGMGSYSPTSVIDDTLADEIQVTVIERAISKMMSEGMPFRGFLYAGIMIRDGIPYVLEFNVRMGDPECQSIAMRMNFDLYEYLLACSKGTLSILPPLRWKKQSAVCVVLTSEGYPSSYPKGEEITGLEKIRNGMVFHAGTRREESRILTNGGRVLGVTALGDGLQDAVSRAYSISDGIRWPHKYCRRDIGRSGR